MCGGIFEGVRQWSEAGDGSEAETEAQPDKTRRPIAMHNGKASSRPRPQGLTRIFQFCCGSPTLIWLCVPPLHPHHHFTCVLIVPTHTHKHRQAASIERARGSSPSFRPPRVRLRLGPHFPVIAAAAAAAAAAAGATGAPLIPTRVACPWLTLSGARSSSRSSSSSSTVVFWLNLKIQSRAEAAAAALFSAKCRPLRPHHHHHHHHHRQRLLTQKQELLEEEEEEEQQQQQGEAATKIC